MLPMKPLLRAAVVVLSLGLLIGCVWFAQKQANPVMMPGSKSISHLIDPAQSQNSSQPVMPGTKSDMVIMSGSKSFTGGTTVTSGVLRIDQTPPALAKP